MAERDTYASISFFCPAHNEEGNLPILIPAAHKFFSKITKTFEILIIENGSTDATPQIADDLAKKYPGVRVLHYPAGLGYGGALREGFLHSQYEYVCYTDSDNQYDVREFAAGFKLMRNHDIASGYVTKKAVSFGRKIQSFIWNLFIRIFFGVSIRDINCSMKIFSRKALDNLQIKSRSAFIDAEMLIDAARAGSSIGQFPVTHFERISGKAIGSSTGVILGTLRDALRYWYGSYWTEIWLFSSAFGIRALYALAIQLSTGGQGFTSWSDAKYFYFAAARNLIEHKAFSIAQEPPYFSDAYHTPLYPIFVALLQWLHMPLFGVILMQDVLAACTIVLIYRLVRHITGIQRVAVIASIVALLEPMSIFWSGLIMSDVLFAFIATLSFYKLSQGKYVAAGFTLGLATLVRPIALFFLPVYVLFVLYQNLGQSKGRLVQVSGVVVIIFAVTIAPWLAYNKVMFNAWSLTSAGWYDVYVASAYPFAKERGMPVEDINQRFAGDINFERFDFKYVPLYRSADFSIMRAAFPQFLYFQAEKSLYSFVSNRYEYLITHVFANELPNVFGRLSSWMIQGLIYAGFVFWVLVYALVLATFVDKSRRPWWLFFAAMVSANALISGGINPNGSDMSRYALPFHVFFFGFAALGIHKIFGKSSTNSSTTPVSGGPAPVRTPYQGEIKGIENKKVVILGAGPAGMGAAWELSKRGVSDITVIDKNDRVGGLARTIEYKGNLFDVGPHRFLTKYAEVDEFWKEMLGPEFVPRTRSSHIYYRDRFFKYPVSIVDTLRNLGVQQSLLAGVSFAWAQVVWLRKEPANFAEWTEKTFGPRMSRIFFQQYFTKVWGISAYDVGIEWAGQRIKKLSLIDFIKRTYDELMGYSKVQDIGGGFYYPRHGAGQLYETMQSKLEKKGVRFLMGRSVVSITHDTDAVRTVVTQDQKGTQETFAGDVFISSIPANFLAASLTPAVSTQMKYLLSLMRFRAHIAVNMIVKRKELFSDTWFYVQSPEYKISRIANYNAFSMDMLADAGTSAIGIEFYCDAGDEFWIKSDQELIDLAVAEMVKLGFMRKDEFSDAFVVRHPDAYPVYYLGYREGFARLREYLERFSNLRLIGRAGMYKYRDQDHALYSGMLTVRNLFGENNDVWELGEEQEFYEEKSVENQKA